MSLWADYHNERYGYETIEVEGGFICYTINPPDAAIEEFYIAPTHRGTHLAKEMMKRVFDLAQAAGAKTMWTKVTPGVRGAEHTMQVCLNYGATLAGVRDNGVILKKEIGD
jgi:GNAT superfamily N-acetyltransferase